MIVACLYSLAHQLGSLPQIQVNNEHVKALRTFTPNSFCQSTPESKLQNQTMYNCVLIIVETSTGKVGNYHVQGHCSPD